MLLREGSVPMMWGCVAVPEIAVGIAFGPSCEMVPPELDVERNLLKIICLFF